MKLFEIKRASPEHVDTEVKQFTPEMEWIIWYHLKYVEAPKAFKIYEKWLTTNPKGSMHDFVVWWKAQINKGLKTFFISKYALAAVLEMQDDIKTVDGKVVADTTLSFEEMNAAQLEEVKPPFKFQYVKDFVAAGCKLGSVDAIPDWFPPTSNEYSLRTNELSSLSGLHKKITECNRIYLRGNKIKAAVLSLLLIKGLKKVDYDPSDLDTKGKKAMKIVIDYIQGGKTGKNHLLECQSEMLDKGLDEYAQL